jgi:peptide/nickel transport system substrate-binding protein
VGTGGQVDPNVAARKLSRRDLLTGIAGLTMSAGPFDARPLMAAEAPVRGGDLRIAILGGGSADTLDANLNLTQPDAARVLNLYQPLRRIRQGGQIENLLAQSMDPNADGTIWTIRLRKGITFHNGKSLTAEDVAYTFLRITDPRAPLLGAPELAPIKRGELRILDQLTLQVPMHYPFALFDEVVADAINLGIIPVGYDPRRPVGTGPFALKSFAPGQQSVFARYADFWGDAAHVDTVTIIDSFANDTAAYNALQGGQVDAFGAAPLTLARLAHADGPIRLLVSEATQWTPFTMRVDLAPFDEPDVRRAFRLIVDREQIIKIALSGFGVPGNDVCSRFDGAPGAFTRHRDIEQAKWLLKRAGQEHLSIELTTAEIANGVNQSAQIFARQAMDAGVTVKVRQVTPDVFFGAQFLTRPFSQDFWTLNPYMTQVALSLLPDSPYNETHWRDPAYAALFKRALSTMERADRAAHIRELQRLDFEQGGYIIPSHNQIIDLYAPHVRGLRPGTFFALGDYDFSKIWLNPA